MPVIDLRFLEGAKGVVMKNGEVYCVKCLKEDASVLGRPSPRMIPHRAFLPRQVGRIISERDVEIGDFAYVCDRCEETIK